MAVNMLQLLTPQTSGGQGEDFTTIERRKQAMALAQELMKDSMSTQPIQSHWQGAAKLAQALVGGMMEQRERGKEAADQKEAFDLLFGGAGGQSSPTGSSASDALPKAPPPSSSPMGALPGMDGAPESKAIASIESGGKYDLLGPVTRTGDRAHGKYQVMGANIGPWTKEALGQEMDAKTFLASPEAQEAVFKAKFGQYQSKYGPEGAARAWFAGEGGMNDMGRKDQLGTSVAAYANKFNQGMARAAAPQQVASLGGAPTNEAPQSAVPVTGSASPPAPMPPQGAQQPAPQQMAQAQMPQTAQPQGPLAGMSREHAMKLFKNPYTRPAIVGALQKQFGTGFEYKEINGKLVAIDPRRNTVTEIYKSEPKKFVDVGTDPVTGQPIKGFVEADNEKVTPYRVPGSQPENSVVPAAPPGVDPKIWREGQSKNVLTNALPMSSDDASKLRKEIQDLPSYKNYQQAFPVYRSMTETAGRNTKASDLNLVYGLGKIFDPNSVVREGEMVMVKNTASLPDWFVGAVNQLNGGAALQPDTRKAIMAEAYTRMKSYEDAFGFDTDHYRGIATRNRGSADDIIPSLKRAEPWAPKDQAAPGSTPTQGGPPKAAIDALRADPNLRQQFEQKYGPGSASQFLGAQ